jgi:hypothetical protein
MKRWDHQQKRQRVGRWTRQQERRRRQRRRNDDGDGEATDDATGSGDNAQKRASEYIFLITLIFFALLFLPALPFYFIIDFS